MGSEPDLDALFGPDEAEAAPATESPVPQVHPALRSAVETLVAESWPQARAELIGSESGDQPSKGARPPLPAALARDVDAAVAAEGRADWTACHEKASAIRQEAWNALIRDKGWQRPCDKELFMLVELLLALSSHASGSGSSAVTHADGVFIFAPAGVFRSCALLFVRLLDDDVRAERAEAAQLLVAGQFPITCLPETPPTGSRVRRLERLADDPGPDKLKELLSQSQPFFFPGALESWPARTRWNSLAYLDGKAGHRLVPTELGSNVGADGWKEELMPFSRFLEEFLAPSCRGAHAQTAYLAQHELFEQCPVLRADIAVPQTWQEVLGAPTRCNAWVGTSRTLTPCHWDSYDNFLAQVQGFKRVVLLAPNQHTKLHVRVDAGTGAQGNISPVNVEEPDLNQYPDFREAETLVVDLAPGDVLYMPSGWWHQVRALTPSISATLASACWVVG